jgi:hypothetical protein
MKTYIANIAFLLIGLTASQAAPLTPKEKVDFVAFYTTRIKLSETFPNDLGVHVMFVDLDADGKEEALATNQGSAYEDGNSWAAFRVAGDSWETIKGYDKRAKVIRPGSGVFARAGEIFRVVKNDGKIDFLVLHENFDKRSPEGIGALHKTRFSIDKEGILQQEPIENLEGYIAYAGASRSGLISKLEVLKVEYFAGDELAKTEEQNKAQHPTDGAAEPEKPKE